MAVTHGHGNPNWNREETILAFDLYCRLDGNVGSVSNDAIESLSELLRSLPYHSEWNKRATFRNIDGVRFKLQNFKSVIDGGGLAHVSKLDRWVVNDFHRDPARLAVIAGNIESNVQLVEPKDFDDADDLELNFPEGRTIVALHRKRERARGLRQRLLAKERKQGFRCKICGLSRPNLTSALEESLFEAHHILPLSSSATGVQTKLADLALLCACCHRAIHKLMTIRGEWVSVEDAMEYLQ